MHILGYGEESVSVGFEEITSDRWKDEVYRPDIEARSHTLYKPGLQSQRTAAAISSARPRRPIGCCFMISAIASD